jgi:hypothetical protein
MSYFENYKTTYTNDSKNAEKIAEKIGIGFILINYSVTPGGGEFK